MNLIEKFENMPFQDVGTFNSIFKHSPILNFKSNEEVVIGELTADNRRKIYISDKVLLMDLTQKKLLKEDLKLKESKVKRVKVKKINIRINPLLKILTPSQFVIYQAIKEAGEVFGIAELSRNIRLNVKSIYNNLDLMKKIGLIKKEEVSSEEGALVKLSIDTSYQLK